MAIEKKLDIVSQADKYIDSAIQGGIATGTVYYNFLKEFPHSGDK